MAARRKRRPWPKWMDEIQVGDIIRARSGLERVVRSVRRFDSGQLHMIQVTIAKCSWTRRAFTCLDKPTLRQGGYRPTGNRSALRGRMDRRLEHAVQAETKNALVRVMSCCDVHGVR